MSNNIGIENYDNLLNDANILESKIESYNCQVKKFFENTDMIQQFWKGEAAKATLDAILKYKENFTDLGLVLKDYVITLRNSVNAFQNVENDIINSRRG